MKRANGNFVSLLCAALISCSISLPALSQEASVSMTLFPVLTGANGQQFYTNQYDQAIQLPGGGVATPTVSIYQSPDGAQWYIDKSGAQQALPPQAPSMGYGMAQNYYPPDYPQQPPQETPPPQNPPQQQSSSSSGTSSTSTSSSTNISLGLGSLFAGIPLGMPIYWGAGGSPYYWGAGGNRVYVNASNQNFNNFNEWKTQNNTWHNNYWNQHNQNNWSHNNNWPGKNHGFPAPWHGNTGRLYSPTPATNPTAAHDAGRGFDGAGRGFDGGGRGFEGDRGGFGGHGFGGGGFGGHFGGGRR